MPEVLEDTLLYDVLRDSVSRESHAAMSAKVRRLTHNTPDIDQIVMHAGRYIYIQRAEMPYERSQEAKYHHALYFGIYLGHVATGSFIEHTHENLLGSDEPRGVIDEADLTERVNCANYLRQIGSMRLSSDNIHPSIIRQPLEPICDDYHQEFSLTSLAAYGFAWASGERKGIQ